MERFIGFFIYIVIFAIFSVIRSGRRSGKPTRQRQNPNLQRAEKNSTQNNGMKNKKVKTMAEIQEEIRQAQRNKSEARGFGSDDYKKSYDFKKEPNEVRGVFGGMFDQAKKFAEGMTEEFYTQKKETANVNQKKNKKKYKKNEATSFVEPITEYDLEKNTDLSSMYSIEAAVAEVEGVAKPAYINAQNLKQAIIFSEVLGKPVALKRRV